jgi:hypothetical protein
MGIPLAVILVLGVLAFAGLLLWASIGRGRRGRAPARQETARSPMPRPGGPSPQKDGKPVPGSAEDRRRHGKP